MSPSCVQMSVFWAAWNKQCMLAAGKHQKLISWRKETTWRPKTLMLGFYETHFGASWRRSDMLLTMAFWLSCKELTFFSRQHCLYISIFFRLLHTIIEIYPFESCPIFYRTTLSLSWKFELNRSRNRFFKIKQSLGKKFLNALDTRSTNITCGVSVAQWFRALF